MQGIDSVLKWMRTLPPRSHGAAMHLRLSISEKWTHTPLVKWTHTPRLPPARATPCFCQHPSRPHRQSRCHHARPRAAMLERTATPTQPPGWHPSKTRAAWPTPHSLLGCARLGEREAACGRPGTRLSLAIRMRASPFYALLPRPPAQVGRRQLDNSGGFLGDTLETHLTMVSQYVVG